MNRTLVLAFSLAILLVPYIVFAVTTSTTPPTTLPAACTTFPCYFDATAITNTWGTVDTPPTYVSALYPYEFTLTTATAVKMTMPLVVWSGDGTTPNTVYVKMDGTVIYTKIGTAYDDTNAMTEISLGTLAAGKHRIEIYASPFPTHFMFDWFRLEGATSTTCGNGVCEAGEADYCPPCTTQPCPMIACRLGTCPTDCNSDTCSGQNQICGTDRQCCSGLTCQYANDANTAGSTGICVPSTSTCSAENQLCGGIAGKLCCPGLTCQYSAASAGLADGSGTCVSAIACKDTDNSQDYLKLPISYPITRDKYPDLYVKGYGTGVYAGGSTPVVYGTEPNPTYAKPSAVPYSIVYDHCSADSNLVEAFCSEGKLNSLGVKCPTGYTCDGGACAPSQTTCSPQNQACTASQLCCEGLTCSGGKCIPTVCAPQTIVSDTTTMFEPTPGVPMPAVATWNQHPSWTANIPGATWIWKEYQVSDPAHDTIVHFTKTFTSVMDSTATFVIASDNTYDCSINGLRLVSNDIDNFHDANKDNYDITGAIIDGTNRITCTVTNIGVAGSTSATNPAGLLYRLDVTPRCAPTYSISHSPANPTSGQTVTITSTSNAVSQKIYVDNALKKSCETQTCTYSNTFSAGKHTYYGEYTSVTGAVARSPVKSFTVTASCIQEGGTCSDTTDVRCCTGLTCQSGRCVKTANTPPKIVSGSIPEVIKVNEPATFSWYAQDPDYDNLAWSVDWGDGTGQAGACISPAPTTASAGGGGGLAVTGKPTAVATAVVKTTTATKTTAVGDVTTTRYGHFSASHAYTRAGRYTVIASVSDCRGGTDTNTQVANVVGSDVVQIVKVPSQFSMYQGSVAEVDGRNTQITLDRIYYNYICTPDKPCPVEATSAQAVETTRTLAQTNTVTGKPTASGLGDGSSASTGVAEPICPAVCVPMWQRQQVQCIRAPCNPVCTYIECGSGCGPDGKTTFKTEELCRGTTQRNYVVISVSNGVGCDDVKGGCQTPVRQYTIYEGQSVELGELELDLLHVYGNYAIFYIREEGTLPECKAEGTVCSTRIENECCSGLTCVHKSNQPRDSGICTVESQNTYVVELKAGWNLFSVPVASTDKVLRAFTSNDNNCQFRSSLWTLENGRYAKSIAAAPLKGYWIKVADSCTVRVPYDYKVSLDENSAELSQGWNMIGSQFDEIKFSEASGTCTFSRGPYWYNPDSRKYELAETMEPGKGYVVNAQYECSIGSGGPPPLPA